MALMFPVTGRRPQRADDWIHGRMLLLPKRNKTSRLLRLGVLFYMVYTKRTCMIIMMMETPVDELLRPDRINIIRGGKLNTPSFCRIF